MTVPPVRFHVPRPVVPNAPPKFNVPLLTLIVPALLHDPPGVSVPPLTVVAPVSEAPALPTARLPPEMARASSDVRLLTLTLPEASVIVGVAATFSETRADREQLECVHEDGVPGRPRAESVGATLVPREVL